MFPCEVEAKGASDYEVELLQVLGILSSIKISIP
jgi:hypothetical protein